MANGFQTYHDRSAEFAAQQGYTLMEDGRYMAPDGESVVGAEEISRMAETLGNDADPLIDGVQYRNIEGWANNDVDPEKAMQLELAHLKRFGIEAVQHPEYGWIVPDDGRLAQAHPDQNSSSIFDFGPILLAAFMVPAIASSLAAAPVAGAAAGAAGGGGALSEAAIADIVAAEGGFSALPSTGMAGTAAGGGLIGSGVEAAAIESGTEVTLSAGQEAAQSIAQEWSGANYADVAMETAPGVTTDVAATVESVAPKIGDVAELTKVVPPSNTKDMASRLVQTAEDVTNAEGGSGAWKAASGAATEGGSLLDRIWKGVTSPQGVGASINVIGGTIGGMGIAGINRDTMLKKSELDLANAEALQKFKTDQSRANMFRGIIGVRPAATRAPLQRLTGGSVYGPTGLIRRA